MKALITAIIATFVAAAVTAKPVQLASVFEGLSTQEFEILQKGEPLIRQLSSPRSVSLVAAGAFPDEIRDHIRTLGANYIGEVLMVIPGATSSGLLQALAKDLSNVEDYVGIPYWSKQNNRSYDLFDKMRIVQRMTQDGGQVVVTEQHMEPFADYRARYWCKLDGLELQFRSENLTTISYKGFNAVAPTDMIWYLYGFAQGGGICLYGVGAVKAFDLFGLYGERLKTSFMGRIEAFFSYLYEKRRSRKIEGHS
jgi:hypothetical protein